METLVKLSTLMWAGESLCRTVRGSLRLGDHLNYGNIESHDVLGYVAKGKV